MPSQKIRDAAKRWAGKQLKPIETLTPKDANWRVACGYMEGYDRGRREQREHSKRAHGNNTAHPDTCLCTSCEPG